jgi:hypothetical protein
VTTRQGGLLKQTVKHEQAWQNKDIHREKQIEKKKSGTCMANTN